MKKKFILLTLALFSVFVYGQKKLDQKTIDQFGTKTFDKSKEELFPVIKKVLGNNNFEIELESIEKGKIKTKKKVIGETGVATGPSSAQFKKNYKQYIVQLESVTPQQTKIVLVPKIWIGDADVSEEKIWVLKGPAGEIKLWENLFNEIQEQL